jgi:eukaryotic-like serine/threonine-protein kinase
MTVPIPESQEDAAAAKVPVEELFAQRYRMGPLLGRGATALVHRAVDERLRRPVALKVFRLEANADLVPRFVAEARLLARLHHPGLVEIFDYGHVTQGPYLALELISGPTLRSLISSGPLPFAETMRIGRSVADTLSYIHAAGVVHRDVKPSNILLDEEGLPRLADFGLSFAVDAAGTTDAGSIVGTAAYLAPEQVLGDRADSAADVFALGLVLIECLTGIREYPGLPVESAVARLHRLPAVPQGLPRGVSETLEQMTAWDPAERPDAEGCAAVFGRPGPIDPVPELSDPVAIPFGADDETVWTQPAVTHSASGKARSGRKLSGALATAAVFMAAGVAVIAFRPGAGGPTAHVHVPAVAAQPHPATAPGSTSTATPPPLQASPPSTPATGNAPPSTLSTTPVAVVAAAVQIDSEPPTEKNKNHGQGKVQGHGHGRGHGQGHPHGYGQDG